MATEQDAKMVAYKGLKDLIATTFGQTFTDSDETHAARTAAALTDSTGETADQTIADVSTVVTGVDGTGNNAASKADVDTRLTSINQNFSDLTDEVNKLRADQVDTAAFLNKLVDELQSLSMLG